MKKTKIGVLSGSLNPIYIGRLVFANYLREFEGPDKVWPMVTLYSPFKKQADL